MIQGRRHCRPHARRRDGRPVKMPLNDLLRALPRERRLAREDVVPARAEGIEVAPDVDVGLPRCLLRRDVVRRSAHGAVHGSARLLHGGEEAEVGELHDAVEADQDIRGLHVAVNEPLRLERAERLANVARDLASSSEVAALPAG